MTLPRGKRHKVRPGNRAMTVAERAHVDAVKRSGCLCCIQRGYEPEDGAPMVEAHHLLRGNLRIDHLHTVGLCEYHHRDRLIVAGWDHAEHRLRLGPSLEQDAAAFHRIFGSDDELLRLQAERLGGAA